MIVDWRLAVYIIITTQIKVAKSGYNDIINHQITKESRKMTKKDFIQQANAIKLIADPSDRKRTAEVFCVTNLKSNPRFNTNIFLKACGVAA